MHCLHINIYRHSNIAVQKNGRMLLLFTSSSLAIYLTHKLVSITIFEQGWPIASPCWCCLHFFVILCIISLNVNWKWNILNLLCSHISICATNRIFFVFCLVHRNFWSNQHNFLYNWDILYCELNSLCFYFDRIYLRISFNICGVYSAWLTLGTLSSIHGTSGNVGWCEF